ncbi:MAG: glycosyltransferase [Planctomycetota bacterium]|nr:glycosyltransferase [Planctomycetota bacterium]
MTPLVSSIIPAFNAEATLARALDSLLAQSVPAWEAIVVDDGSTDGTGALARAYAARDRRIRVVSQPNAGPSIARNQGIGLASGAFVYFLDADDWLLPAGFEGLLGGAGAGDAACGATLLCDPAGRTLHRIAAGPGVVDEHRLALGNALCTGSHLVRRARYDAEKFDPARRAAEDFDLWSRLAARGLRWTPVDADVSVHRVMPAGLSSDVAGMLRAVREILSRSRERLALEPAGRAARAGAPARAALEFCTLRAAGDATPERAVDMWRADPTLDAPGVISPAHTADAARWAPVLVRAVHESSASAWEVWPGVLRWWRACERAGWGAPGFARDAAACLAPLLVAPEAIMDALLHGLEPPDAVLVAGYGTNGRLLVDAARARGLDVDIHDDRLPAGAGASAAVASQAGASAPAFPPSGPEGLSHHSASRPQDSLRPKDPLRPDTRAVIVTPLDDERLASRWAGDLRLRRWRVVRDELAATIDGRLATLLDAVS